MNSNHQDKLASRLVNYENLLHEHYENFPIALPFFPKRIRRALVYIYAFSRIADDIADEGTICDEQRFKLLTEFREEFLKSKNQNSQFIFFNELRKLIESENLDELYFLDLLDAFVQDTHQKVYATIEDVFEYCQKSAVPVGRLMLSLFHVRDSSLYAYSDSICTGLQITNFLQDIKEDYHIQRIYLAQNEIKIFGVETHMLGENRPTTEIKNLVKFQLERCQALLNSGRPLISQLSGPLKYYLRLTLLGGLTILKKINKDPDMGFNKKIELNRIDKLTLIFRTITGFI